MRVGLIGINHKSAGLALRERVARAVAALPPEFHCIILSTCNRTEIYFSDIDLARRHSELLNYLQTQIKEPFEHALYAYFGRECFLHLARVTAGLDSALAGESEIQRQVKVAYQVYKTLADASLHFLFQKCLQLGKEVRTEFSLYRNSIELERVILEIGKDCFPSIATSSILMVGNSEMNRRIIRLLVQRGINRITLATRFHDRVDHCITSSGITITDWSQLFSWSQYQWVICSTTSDRYIIEPQQGDRVTMLICDLSLPRSVNPSLGDHKDLRLLNLEQIESIIQNRRTALEYDMAQVEHLLSLRVDEQMDCFERGRDYRCCVSFA